ncbi:MAG: sugar ABC transporter substrate-binding protein [Anaerocolumna sp.]
MEKLQKYGFILMLFMILVLYLVSSTELIFSDDTDHEIYHVSVIVDDTTDSTWQNYKKGMEQAAMDYNVDVSFITLYSERNVEEQLDFIKRESQEEAQAIVLAAVDSKKVAAGLNSYNNLPPIINIGTQFESEKVKVSVVSKGREIGEKLGQLIVEDIKRDYDKWTLNMEIDKELNNDLDKEANKNQDKNADAGLYNIPIYIIPGNTKQTSLREKLDGLVNILELNQCKYYIKYVEDEDIKATMLEASTKSFPQVFVGLDTNILLAMAEEQLYTKLERNLKIYGVGYTNFILSSLEKEQLSGIIVENDYLKGYLSIQEAVSLIKYNQVDPEVILDNFTITPKTVHDPEYEILLYPIS